MKKEHCLGLKFNKINNSPQANNQKNEKNKTIQEQEEANAS